MANFRFLHAADIHLDSPLVGLSRYEGLPVDEIRGATRAAFDNLIDYACEERVDFLIIAGDLFDGDWRDMSTGLYFARAMGKLDQAGIPVYLLQGNHDAASVITKNLPWPGNVKRFGTKVAEPFKLEGFDVFFHGLSFPQATVNENLVQQYPVAVPNAFNIGVLHTSLSGHPGHARYAPCDITDLKMKGYDYWALGHVHDFQQMNTEPAVIFPGNLQGRHIRETGPKGAVLVEVEDRAISRIELIELDVIRWARVAVDCGGSDGMEELHARIREALAAARTRSASDRGLIARLVLEGETLLADTISDRRETLRDEARALAAAIAPDLWLEKISVRTRPIGVQNPTLSGDLLSLLTVAEEDPLLIGALAEALAPFLSAVSAEVPSDPEDLRQAALVGDWHRVVATAAAGLRARLGATDYAS